MNNPAKSPLAAALRTKHHKNCIHYVGGNRVGKNAFNKQTELIAGDVTPAYEIVVILSQLLAEVLIEMFKRYSRNNAASVSVIRVRDGKLWKGSLI